MTDFFQPGVWIGRIFRILKPKNCQKAGTGTRLIFNRKSPLGIKWILGGVTLKDGNWYTRLYSSYILRKINPIRAEAKDYCWEWPTCCHLPYPIILPGSELKRREKEKDIYCLISDRKMITTRDKNDFTDANQCQTKAVDWLLIIRLLYFLNKDGKKIQITG